MNSNSKKYALLLITPPPAFAFASRVIVVELQLVQLNKGHPIQNSLNIRVELCACDGTPLASEQKWLELTTPSKFRNSSNASINLFLHKEALHQTVALKFSSTSSDVAPVLSKPLHIGSHALVIENHPAPIFYKDGPKLNLDDPRSGFLRLITKLINANGEVVEGCRVPIRLTLVYANDHTVVEDQSHFRANYRRQPHKLNSDGRLVVEYSIRDVSKNHNNRPFAVKVEATPHECFVHLGAIGCAFSEGTQVLSKMPSKVKKRKRMSSPTQTSTSEMQYVINRLDAIEDAIKSLQTEQSSVKKLCVGIVNMLQSADRRYEQRRHLNTRQFKSEMPQFSPIPRSPSFTPLPTLIRPSLVPSVTIPALFMDPAGPICDPMIFPSLTPFEDGKFLGISTVNDLL